MRVNRRSHYPDPSMIKVVPDMRTHLPDDTPVVTAGERQEQLRARSEAAQLRQIW